MPTKIDFEVDPEKGINGERARGPGLLLIRWADKTGNSF